MGWTVLYIAFGVVALWLLGEVLLQYKARLRWRLLAFFGFLFVVLGVVLPSVLVIAVGTVAFAAGQTLVTLSFRRGFSTGWALGGKPGTSRRRREGAGPAPGEMQPLAPVEDAAPADHGGEYSHDGAGPYEGRYENAYEEQSGQDAHTPAHGVPAGGWQGAAGPGQGAGGQGPGGYGGYGEGGYGAQPDPYAAQPYAPSYHDPYADQAPAHAAQGTGQTYPAYADAYGSAAQAGGYPEQEDPLTAPGHAPGGAPQAYPAGTDQWAGAQSSYTETPAGGVWVPQQRDVTEPAAGYGYPQVPPQPAYGPGEAAPYPPPAGYDGGQGYYGGEHRY
ncbi:hypothetical protein GCM10009716_31100 [Streptomyces sodiiphilus]|uniref:Uncharacterized protein n=1 Tax=Streptomyces sodiiphilus TaxID=226217 RepID=A0ABN2PH05_9ACTN